MLNTGQTTYTHHNGNETVIDISLASKNLALRSDWEVLSDSLGSDHRPILVSVDQKVDRDEVTHERFNTRKADWRKFESLCTEQLTDNCCDDDTDVFYGNITSAIIVSASASIPTSKATHRPRSVPYWNKDCGTAVKNRNKAHKVLKQSNTLSNNINYKKTRAKARHTIKHAQKQYWTDYCGGLNHDTKLSSVWRMAKSMAGNHSQSSIPNLAHNNVNYTTIITGQSKHPSTHISTHLQRCKLHRQVQTTQSTTSSRGCRDRGERI